MKIENSQINIPLERKEELVNELLIYIKNEIENTGRTIKTCLFNFSLLERAGYFNAPDEIIPEGENLTAYKQITNINDSEFEVVIKYCMTHQYLKKAAVGNRNYDWLVLTDKGLARANSAEKASFYKPKEQTSPITFNGPIHASNLQIGNNNTQNIENIKNNLINKIEKADVSPEEKEEAKNLLTNFFGNPVISSIISGVTGAGVTALLGGS